MSEEIKNLQEELNDQMQIRRDKLAEYEADVSIHLANDLLLKIMQKILKMTS